MTWLVGVWGLQQSGLWKKMPLIVVVGRHRIRDLAA